jgi:2'-5' RNA ligase
MNQARQIYDQLWSEALPAFQRGEPRIDPHLPDKRNDRRRGVSLAFRPSPSVQVRARSFLDQLAAEFPGQYFYRPGELHVTVLTMISTTEFWRKEIGDLAAFRGILAEVLPRQHSFKLDFCGVTAAPNAALIQGFPLDGGLEKIREALRRGFAQRGFANRLDRRYPNRAAHMTAMRFCRSDTDWRRLAAVLSENRQTHFGATHVDTLELIWGDWYASTETERILGRYHLPDAMAAPAFSINPLLQPPR